VLVVGGSAAGAGCVGVAVKTAVARIFPGVDTLYVANLPSAPFFVVADAYPQGRDLGLEKGVALRTAAPKEPLEQKDEHPDHHQGVGEVEDRP